MIRYVGNIVRPCTCGDSSLLVVPFWLRIIVIAIASWEDSEVLPSMCFHCWA